jgi:molecular chaperone GrpE
VELHALRVDALRCAATARSRRERTGFETVAGGLERLLAGRGGSVVAPLVGEPFSGSSMEAVEVVPTGDAELDRTVAELLEPGLLAGGRSVRPARVAVHRHRPA